MNLQRVETCANCRRASCWQRMFVCREPSSTPSCKWVQPVTVRKEGKRTVVEGGDGDEHPLFYTAPYEALGRERRAGALELEARAEG